MSAEIDVPGNLVAHGRSSYAVFINDGSAMAEGRSDDERAGSAMLFLRHTQFVGPSTHVSVSLREFPSVV
jgi:hypothetical protein